MIVLIGEKVGNVMVEERKKVTSQSCNYDVSVYFVCFVIRVRMIKVM